ncbi:MAG: MarR family transcriptional regulator [Candidatus Bathyarchaeia archaeon]
MNETEKKIILTLAKHGALNIYQLEKHANLKHATACKSVKKLERDNLVEVVSESIFKTGLKTKQFWLTWHGVFQAYALGADLATLKNQCIKHQGNLTDEEIEAIEAVFSFMQFLGRERIDIFIKCVNFSTTTPKIKYLPLNIVSPEELQRMMDVLSKNRVFKKMLKASSKKIIKIFQKYTS